MKTKKIILCIIAAIPTILFPLLLPSGENEAIKHWVGIIPFGMMFSLALFLLLGQIMFWGRSFPEEVFPKHTKEKSY